MVRDASVARPRGAALTMGNPTLVEVMRGALVESRHRGAVAVVDAGGKSVFALGEVERPVYPRSAIKALQALCLLQDVLRLRIQRSP